MTLVFAIVLAVVTLVLFPVLLRIVATLLEIGMLLVVAYALTTYVFPVSQFSPQWWITYVMSLGGCAVIGMGLYILMVYIQHPLRHGQSWDDATPCRACNEDEVVNTYLLTRLQQKVATLSPLTRTLNELLASIRALPMSVMAFGVSIGLIVYGVFAENPLWALAGGIVYGTIVTWQIAGRDYKAQTQILAFLGMTRHDALQKGRAMETASIDEAESAIPDWDEEEAC